MVVVLVVGGGRVGCCLLLVDVGFYLVLVLVPLLLSARDLIVG